MADDERRTPIPPIDTTAGSGYEWLGRFMEAHASLAGNALFLTFKLGQVGVAGQLGDVERARALLDDLRTDRADIAFAADQLDTVLDHLIANIASGLDEAEAAAGEPEAPGG